MKIEIIFIKWFMTIMSVMMISGVVNILELNAQERDPFTSIIDLKEQELSEQKKINLSKAVLKGIIWNPKRAIAIINDDLVMAGENWQGFKVERIDRDNVILSDKLGSYKLVVEQISPAGKRDSDKTDLNVLTPDLLPQIPGGSAGPEPEGVIPYPVTERPDEKQ